MAWATLLGLDSRIDLANMALILVLGAAVAAIWSKPWASLAASAAAILVFNFAFVPPRGTFSVDLRQHALLLVTMLTVSWIVTLLVARLRWHAAEATAHARRSDQLRLLGEALRAADTPADQAAVLQRALSELGGGPATLLLHSAEGVGPVGEAGDWFVGSATPDEAAGLRLCLHDGRAMGPGGAQLRAQAWVESSGRVVRGVGMSARVLALLGIALTAGCSAGTVGPDPRFGTAKLALGAHADAIRSVARRAAGPGRAWAEQFLEVVRGGGGKA